MNTVTIIGRLTRDPEVRYTQDDMAIANFTVAVDRPPNGKVQKATDFPKCVAIGKRAQFCEKWLYKGQMVAVSGSIRTGSYEKDGRTIYTTDIMATEIQPLEWKKEGGFGNGFDR